MNINRLFGRKATRPAQADSELRIEIFHECRLLVEVGGVILA